MSNETDQISSSIQRLRTYIESENFLGYDPYDALNSFIFHVFPFNQKYLRLIGTQLIKKSPINLRPFLNIQKGFNPKGLGLLLMGYIRLYSIDKDPILKQKIKFLTGKVIEFQSHGFSGLCWGYNFPWQNRYYLFPKYTPTIVNTSFIGHSFLDAYEAFGEKRYLDYANSACQFILNDLNIVSESQSELCLSYTPMDHMRVYNSNALGASLLARVGFLKNDDSYRTVAQKMANYVCSAQNPDGSWFYGENSTQKWIDIHHTGFVLESLLCILKLSRDQMLHSRLAKGYEYFIKHFILSEGRVRSWHNRAYPIDIHAIEAVIALCKGSSFYQNDPLLHHIVLWFIRNFQDSKGYFYFQKFKNFTNKISYMRWSQSWVFHALTTYYAYSRREINGAFE